MRYDYQCDNNNLVEAVINLSKGWKITKKKHKYC